MFQGIPVSALNWQIWKMNPHRDSLGNINSRIKVQSPFVQIEALKAHEIRPILEDQIFVFFGGEFEEEVPSPKKVRGNTLLD